MHDQQIEIPLQSKDTDRIPVQIWGDQCSAARVSLSASQWFSDALGIECDLVFLPQSEQRLVDPGFALASETVGFADGFPLLVLSKASIDVLNQQLDEPVSINRFRANIIIDGCEAHAEDQWKSITIDDIKITLAKPCSRCVIPSIDQLTAEKHPQLLRTLAQYRRRDGVIYYGQNGLHHSQGCLSVGQEILPHSM